MSLVWKIFNRSLVTESSICNVLTAPHFNRVDAEIYDIPIPIEERGIDIQMRNNAAYGPAQKRWAGEDINVFIIGTLKKL